MATAWELVKAGEYQRACELADVEASRTSTLPPLRSKICAFLQLGQFKESERLSELIIQKEAHESASDFIFKGVAQWLQGRAADAIDSWKRSEKAKYADAAGGVKSYLLLHYAAVLTVDRSLRDSAARSLDRFSNVRAWPAPLAGFVLGRLSKEEVYGKMTAQPVLRARQMCQAQFYFGVAHLEVGEPERAREAFSLACSQNRSSLLEPEFFLASFELPVSQRPR
jgi:hypothetical protein